MAVRSIVCFWRDERWGKTIEDGVVVVFQEDPGLTPRLCEGLFARIEEERKNERNYGISVR